MLMKFKHLDTMDGIHQNFNQKKFDETLMTYLVELRSVRQFYETNKDNPPMGRYHPPVAGRIWWVRALFYCIKAPIVNFRTQKEAVKSDLGQRASSDYLALAREMKAYEDYWYRNWVEVCAATIGTHLQANVFIKQPAVNELGPDAAQNAEQMVIKVHVPPEVLEMIQEAIHLEQMGYRISEKIRNMALLRETLNYNSRMLSQVLESYYTVRKRIRLHEAEFMERAIRNLEKNFDQGLTHLKWTALGIVDYASNLADVVKKFDGVVSQINFVSKDLRVRILEMKTYRLYKEPPYKKNTSLAILECWDFFKYWENHREKIWNRLVYLYEGLSPLFLKLEDITYGKKSGRNKRLWVYYMHWEKCVFKYLSKVVIRSLYDFEVRMTTDEALFDIDAVLAPPEIRITPSAHEIFQFLATAARDCVEGTKKFVRWRRGSCIPVNPIMQSEGEPFIYSLYTDIGRLPRILQILLQIQENLKTILKNLWQYLKKYREFKNLWLYNKEKTVKTFSSKNPSVKTYNDKMSFYTDMHNRVLDLPPYRVEGCIRLNLRPLQTAVSKLAREWVLMLGEYLHNGSKELSQDFNKKVTDFETDLRKLPRTDHETKKLLAAIASVQPVMIDMEVRYRDLLERYAVMEAYDIEFSEDEVKTVEAIWRRWLTLSLHEIKTVNKKADALKKRFNM